MNLRLTLIYIFVVILKLASCTRQSLPEFNVDISETTVSGLSAGGFFAVQMQVAYSSIIKGAGIIAGGPFHCGGQGLYSLCMYSNTPLITTSIQKTNEWSGKSIDDKSNLSKQKVYMISGSNDATVSTNVMNQLYKYYVTDSQFIPKDNVVYNKELKSGHTWPTNFDSVGNSACEKSASPYISNCNFDAAGAILKHVYGNLKPKNSGASTGSLVEFDQSVFISNPIANGLDNKGFIYVPKACSDGDKCKLHIVFHGCLQSYSTIGDKFVKNTGFESWADANNILVLFPQAHPDNMIHPTPTNYYLSNPNGCFDWIGWYDPNFATKNGIQMRFIKDIIDKLTK